MVANIFIIFLCFGNESFPLVKSFIISSFLFVCFFFCFHPFKFIFLMLIIFLSSHKQIDELVLLSSVAIFLCILLTGLKFWLYLEMLCSSIYHDGKFALSIGFKNKNHPNLKHLVSDQWSPQQCVCKKVCLEEKFVLSNKPTSNKCDALLSYSVKWWRFLDGSEYLG